MVKNRLSCLNLNQTQYQGKQARRFLFTHNKFQVDRGKQEII